MKKFIFLLVCLLTTLSFATTYFVPDDYRTIQRAINVAENGDTVLVRAGVYTGAGNRDISFQGKAITVKSTSGAENCIIDCEQHGRGFWFHNGETRESVIDGISIINGNSINPAYGGGIYIENSSSPTIQNIRIFNCVAVLKSKTLQIHFSVMLLSLEIAPAEAVVLWHVQAPSQFW